VKLRPAQIALLGLAAAMLLYCALDLRVETNVLHFLPEGRGSEHALISMRLADSSLTRTMAIAISAEEPALAREAARALEERLRGRPEVAWVRTGVDPEQLRHLYELAFPRRHYFVSDEPEREIPQLLSDAALRERARALRHMLASPASTLLEQVASADPIGSFERIVRRFRGGQPAMRVEGGQFVSADGRWAIVLLATHASAFASAVQGPLLDFIDAAFAEIAAERGGGLEMEQSGASRFAVESERRIKGDVYAIAACSFFGLAAIFLLLVGGPWRFVLVAVPPLAGILVATTLCLLWLGRLDGLTVAFGAALMGVAVDYSVHILVHHGLAPEEEDAHATARRLRGTLGLGAATTVASFAGMALTSVPAFREMSGFAMIGLTAALGAALFVLPDLLGPARSVPPRAQRLARSLAGAVRGLERRRWVPLAGVLALLLAAPLLLPRLHWVDDLSRLGDLDPKLFQEDQRVRDRISRFDAGRFVVAAAPDPAAAIRLNDEVHRRLQPVIAAGGLEGTRSLHSLLWSEELQRRNLRAIEAEKDLPQRVASAFAAEGFRPEAFGEFRRYLETGPPPPLRLADLRQSAFADLISPWIFSLGDRTAVATYLRGLHSEEAVRAAIQGLPGVYLFDNRTFVNDVYREFRESTLEQMLVGSALVIGLLLARYRRWRPALAAFLPSLLVALALLEVFALTATDTNLLHVMSLLMVLGMGVDYGIFVVDSAGDRAHFGATMLSLLVSCATTVFVFGTLAISSNPALRAIGVTTGLGVALALVFAPVSLLVLGRTSRE
jgi:predicted exporter